jgi:hypothetical protein
MEVSGEVADLLVKEGLQVAELAAKLSGKGAVNVTALLAAMVKNNYKVVGKVGVDRLNRENVESVVIPIRSEDMPRFEKLAKQFGVLYAAAKGESSEVLHIISNVNYSAQLNAVLEAMGYGLPTLKKEDSVKKAKTRAPQEKSSVEHGIGLKPSVREKLEQFKAVAEQAKTPQRVIGKGKVR